MAIEMQWVVEKSSVRFFVTSISWERINLTIDVLVTGDLDEAPSDSVGDSLNFYAVNNLGEANIKFKKEKLSTDTYRLRVNITNNGSNECVPTGTYRIYACNGNSICAEGMVVPEIVGQMDDLSRNFLYSARNRVYSVTLFVEDDATNLPFRMRVLNASRSGMAFPRRSKFHKAFRPFKAIWNSFLSPRNIIRLFYKLVAKLSKTKRQKTVLFFTEQGDKIGSNQKAVSDRMRARGLDSKFDILECAFLPTKQERRTLGEWCRIAICLGRSGVIFLDDHAPILDWLKLDDDTQLIQLWHAGAGFKSSGYSRWGHTGCPAPQSCHRQYSYGVAGSKNIAPFFSEVWGINNEQVLPTGMPRIDEFLDENYRHKKTTELYKEFPMCQGKKVILFAPTYRGTNKPTAYYPYELIDFKGLYDLCGDEYVVLFKMHPWVNEDIVIEPQYQDKFFDVKNYPNINDLFYIVDLLITDYSSSVFEFSLMHKPMLFFAFDRIQYSFSRGFHRPYEESAPGKVCETFDDILSAIQNKDFDYDKVEAYIEHHFDYLDGGASDRVIDWILLGKMPPEMADAIRDANEEAERRDELHFEIPE